MASPGEIDSAERRAALVADEQERWRPTQSRETHDSNTRIRWQGPLMCLTMFITSTLGCIFLMFPLTPLLYFRQYYWRRMVDLIITNWISLPAALMYLFCRTKIVVTGDEFLADAVANKGNLIVSNHRCRFDWLYVWGFLEPNHPQLLNQLKIILKKPLKLIPGIGWSIQSANYIFIERKWEIDKQIMLNALDYAKFDSGRGIMPLLYPEGTDFAPGGLQKSRAFADKMKLDFYQYCLHPRTTGFSFLALSMLKRGMLNYVYDITIAYPKNIVQNEIELFRYGTPREVHVHVKRYTAKDIFPAYAENADGEFPENFTETASLWLTNRWAAKEKLLTDYYMPSNNGRQSRDFSAITGEKVVMNYGWEKAPDSKQNFLKMYAALVIWPTLTIFWLLGIWFWWPVRLYAFLAAVWFIVMGKCYNGIEMVEQSLFLRRVDRQHEQ